MTKKYFLLVPLLIGLFSGIRLSAQSSDGWPIYFDSGTWEASPVEVCTGRTVNIATSTLFTGYSTGETAQIDIDWGDGSSTVQTVTFACAGPGPSCYYVPNHFSHVYSMEGAYQAIFTFVDTHGNTDADTSPVTSTYHCGNIYTNVLWDHDQNGTGDVIIPGALLDFTDANSLTTNVLFTGNGIYHVDISAFPASLSMNPGWLAANNFVMAPSSPVSQTVDSVYQLLDYFVLTCDPANPVSQPDLSVNYMYGWNFRAGQHTGFLELRLCNTSCSGTQNADFDLTFDPLLTVFDHNIPGATITGNTLHANMDINACNNYILHFEVPGTAPALTPLNFSGNLSPVGNTDINTANNAAFFTAEVRNSWDPNDKSVNKPRVVSPSVVDEFTYVVRFQNMGNDEAYTIVIKDTLDADLDLATFTFVEQSHAAFVNVDPVTRVATFSFPGIHLPAASVDEPGSHGYLIYKIKENASLPVGTEITNTAYIYFDYNSPVITNTTFNINQFSGVNETVLDAFVVYPVPASEYFGVSSKNNEPLGSIKLMDMTGKTVFAATTNQPTYSVDVKTLANGVYTLLLKNGTTVLNQKVVIQK